MVGNSTVPLSQLLAEVETPKGRERLRVYLESLPFPHFEAHPGAPRLYVRIDEDGKRTIGRFVDRKFMEAKIEADQLADTPNRS
jgi:hypothetical protein